MRKIGRNQTSGRGRGAVAGYTVWNRKCAQYVTKGGQRVALRQALYGFLLRKARRRVGAFLARRLWKRTLARGWSETVRGKLVDLEYGKSLRGYQAFTGPYRVYGTDRPEVVSENELAILTAETKVLNCSSRTVGAFLHKIRSAKTESRALAPQRDALLPGLISGGMRAGKALPSPYGKV